MPKGPDQEHIVKVHNESDRWRCPACTSADVWSRPSEGNVFFCRTCGCRKSFEAFSGSIEAQLDAEDFEILRMEEDEKKGNQSDPLAPSSPATLRAAEKARKRIRETGGTVPGVKPTSKPTETSD